MRRALLFVLLLASSAQAAPVVVNAAGHDVVELEVPHGALVSDGSIWQPLFATPLGPSADGERVQHLAVDGHGITRWQTAPDVTRCDGEARLFVEEWDFARGHFRPVDPPLPDGESVAASPLPAATKDEGTFRFVAASASIDAERHADRLAPPVELGDDRDDTWWTPGSARAWVVARSAQPALVRAVEVDALPRSAVFAAAVELDGHVYRTTFKGGRSFIALPPTTASCVALVVDGEKPGWVMAGVHIVTGSAGQDSGVLVEKIRTGALGAVEAERRLQGLGAAATAELVDGLTKGAAEPATIQLIALLGGTRDPRAVGALLRALGDRRTAVADAARVALVALPPAVEAVARLAADPTAPTATRVEAVQVLAGWRAYPSIIELAGQGASSLRAVVRGALAATADGRALAAQALLGCDGSDWSRVTDLARVADDARVAPVVDGLYGRASWDAKLALLALAGRIGVSPVLERALRDPEPIVRRAAIWACAGMPPDRWPLSRTLLTDDDPGVRHDALAADLGDDAARIAALDDPWPEVRSAAIAAIGRHCALPSERALWEALDGHRDTIALRLQMLAAADHCGLLTAQYARFVSDDTQPPALVAEAARRGAKVARGPLWTRGLERCIQSFLDGDLGNPEDPEDTAGERNARALAACTDALAANRPITTDAKEKKRLAKLLGTLTALPVPVVQRAGERALQALDAP